MDCSEAIYSENALDYIVGNYRGEEFVNEMYDPDCYIALDNMLALIYKETEDSDSDAVKKYGFAAIPNVYGLMSTEALEESGVLRLRRQPELDLYGQGVLIGFVDTGIDFTHPAFVREDNSSKIIALWDQTLAGGGDGPFPYGSFFERDALNEALASEDPFAIVPSRDENGHGTFLAGVAAGNENRALQFSGVAPLAELVIVKCKQAKQVYRDYYRIPEKVDAYQENDIIAGIAFILEIARREGRQAVVCLGMGTNMGSHSGGSYLSLFMERYTSVVGTGMVACIGNEGNARHHHLIRSSEETINIDVEKRLNGFMAQLWWRTPGNISLDIISPSGQTETGFLAVPGERKTYYFRSENTTVEVHDSIPQEFTREQVIVFRFLSPGAGIWKVRVHADYEYPYYHMWLPIRQFLSSEVVFLEPDPDTTLSSASSGDNVVTVSAYDVIEDSLYLQAGRGFTSSDDVKPEVVAPGVNIMGTYPMGRYGAMTGTGVAAAFAAGVGALFMQYYADYNIGGIALREIFIRGASKRGDPYPNTEWGFGILDAYRSLIGS